MLFRWSLIAKEHKEETLAISAVKRPQNTAK
jgi:hypothetical protein